MHVIDKEHLRYLQMWKFFQVIKLYLPVFLLGLEILVLDRKNLTLSVYDTFFNA